MIRKYIWPIVITFILLGSVAAISGYRLFTAQSHFTVEEGIQVEYWDGQVYQPLLVNGSVFDLGQVTINPGETDTFKLRARNNASTGVLGLTLTMEHINGITHYVVCNSESNGLQYTNTTDVILFKVPGDSAWRSVDITTFVDGSMPLGDITFSNILTRSNAETSYENTCT